MTMVCSECFDILLYSFRLIRGLGKILGPALAGSYVEGRRTNVAEASPSHKIGVAGAVSGHLWMHSNVVLSI